MKIKESRMMVKMILMTFSLALTMNLLKNLKRKFKNQENKKAAVFLCLSMNLIKKEGFLD